MYRILLNTLLSILILIPAGCSTSLNIQTDYDRKANFTGLKSYSWIKNVETYEETGALGFDSGIMARRIKDMVEAELDSMGYTQKLAYDREGATLPDFQIAYRMLATEEVEVVRNAYPVGYHSPHHGGHGGHTGYRGHGGHGGLSSGGYTREFVQCVLMLDIWDPRTDRLVWRGWARWEMDEQPSSKDVSMQLNRAVDKILDKFPPLPQTES